MTRRDFITKGCTACVSALVVSAAFSSCNTTQFVTGKLNRNGILVNTTDFIIIKNGQQAFRPFIVVRNEELQYPVCLYRFNETTYSALWMQCTHQGTELQVSGDYLQCPAHGSEFNNKGWLINGPAYTDLRTFPVTISGKEIFIDLRKV
jgi:Rieske Fe-S protein